MKFQKRRTKDKLWRVRIVGRNGRILLSSEGYKREAGADKVIRLVKEWAIVAPIETSEA